MANLQKIKDLADKRQMSIRELAEKVGLRENQLHVICRTNSTKIDTLEKIAHALHAPISCFFDDIPAEQYEQIGNHNLLAHQIDKVEGEMLKPKSAADGELPITTGEGSVLINSGGSRVDTNSGTVIYKALDEIAEQRKLTAKAHEQIDRLLSIIERLTNG